MTVKHSTARESNDIITDVTSQESEKPLMVKEKEINDQEKEIEVKKKKNGEKEKVEKQNHIEIKSLKHKVYQKKIKRA